MARILAALLARLWPPCGRHRRAAGPCAPGPRPAPGRRIVRTGRAVLCELVAAEADELPLVRPFIVQWEQAERRRAPAAHGGRVAV